jgi:acyl carrier protein
MDTKTRIIKIFSAVFNVDKHKIELTDIMDDIESWDSIGQLQLIMNIESEFGIKLNTEDVIQIDSVKKCIAIVNKLLSEQERVF